MSFRMVNLIQNKEAWFNEYSYELKGFFCLSCAMGAH